jgi:hypothetical protein
MLKYTAITKFKGIITVKTAFKIEVFNFSNENNYYLCRMMLADKTTKDNEKIKTLKAYCDITEN